MRGGPVDAADDPADVVDGQWPGQAAGRGAVGPSQSSPHLAHGLGGDRVGHADGAVHVPDDGAGQVEGAGGAAGFGAFGQVGAHGERVGGHGERVGGHGGDGAVGAPALPLAPDQVVLAAGIEGVRRDDGLADADGVQGVSPARVRSGSSAVVDGNVGRAVAGRAASMSVFMPLS